jgi:hypothetical protein
VSGVNGIRKTSSVHQQWFKDVLQQALGDSYMGPKEDLPDGADSFFRQLDYMMATLTMGSVGTKVCHRARLGW